MVDFSQLFYDDKFIYFCTHNYIQKILYKSIIDVFPLLSQKYKQIINIYLILMMKERHGRNGLFNYFLMKPVTLICIYFQYY